MMRRSLVGVLVWIATSAALAAPGQKYLTADDAIMAQSKSWQKTGVAKPILSDDGRILYPFGQYMPTLVCSTFHVCDIQLQPGEVVIGTPFIGDTRATLTPATSGPNGSLTSVIVKPISEDFETNIVIPTDRRIYRIKFKSSKKEAGDYMHSMGFYYPEDTKSDWENYAKAKQESIDKRASLVQAELGGAGFDLNGVDFDYKVEGSASFKPERVFSASGKTFIQFPGSVRSGEAPILVVMDDKEKPISVNYRAKPYGCADSDCTKSKGDMLIVDYVIKQAQLVLGKDSDMIRVDIRSGSATKSWWRW